MKKYAGSLRLDLAQFRELEAFAQMGTELDAATQKQLDRGIRLVEVLKQGQYVPMAVEEQVSILFAATQGYMDKVPVEKVKDFEAKFLAYMKSSHKDLLSEISSTGVLQSEDKFKNATQEFVDRYMAEVSK